jgi:hypothetical protein
MGFDSEKMYAELAAQLGLNLSLFLLCTFLSDHPGRTKLTPNENHRPAVPQSEKQTPTQTESRKQRPQATVREKP